MPKSKELLSGLLVFFTLFSLVSCRVQYVPVEHTEYVTVRDSVYLRDTTIQYKVEKEYVRDYTGLLDTLRLKTGMAEAKAWVDTSRAVLAGEIKNKEKVVDIPVQVKEKVTVRDSIVYKDVPVPVEVEKVVHPRYEGWLWFYVVLTLLAFIAYLLWKFKK